MTIKRGWAAALVVAGIWSATTAAADDGAGEIPVLTIDGPIGPAVADYVHRGLRDAQDDGAPLVVLRMDTPGGLDVSMRKIIRDILASSVPVASFVAPAGARAASAGTYILYASHIAAMAPATNLGAATPVQIGMPGPLGGDDNKNKGKGREQADSDPMHKKIVNDAAAYIRGLARLRGRNVEWAEQAVREAVSLSAQEALKKNVIDLMANDVAGLLAALDGRKVSVAGQDRVLALKGLAARSVEPDWRYELLATITNPTVIPILMMLGVFGLLYELWNPGFVLPGVIGGICLLLALYAVQVLPVSYAGLALIFLGIAFMLAEAFVPSFGALGIGGVVAFVFGSIMLMDTDVEGFQVYWPVVLGVGVAGASLSAGVATMLMRSRRTQVVSGREEMIGAVGVASDDFEKEGYVRVHSENWKVYSNAPVQRGQRVKVVGMDGLILHVEPVEREEP